jgi:hypothetical protein
VGTGVLTERRRSPRIVCLDQGVAPQARLRTGATLVVIDLSEHGCLAECTSRLLPGRRLDLRLSVENRSTIVPARVLRAYVHAIASDGIRYRAALGFDTT